MDVPIFTINSWINRNHVEVLNVAGSRASKDPQIYQKTRDSLRTVLHHGIMRGNRTNFLQTPSQLSEKIESPYKPKTVDEAVDRLISELSLSDKVHIANVEENKLSYLHPTIGKYIRDKFGLWSGNDELMESCRFVSKKYGIHYDLHEDDASALIIRELWKKLRQTHVLRPVK